MSSNLIRTIRINIEIGLDKSFFRIVDGGVMVIESIPTLRGLKQQSPRRVESVSYDMVFVPR